MIKLTYLVIIVVILSGYVTQNLSGALRYLPELLSALVALVVMLRIAATRSMLLSPKYIVFAIIAVMHLIVGMVINAVPPGAIVLGIRPYLKWVPIFLIPIAYRFTEGELKSLLKFILVMALLQCPFTLFQRFFQYKDLSTGDVITGTLGSGASGALSVFMVSVIAMLIAFYLKKFIQLKLLLMLMGLVFIPTAINETKVTLLLLPLSMVVPYMFAARNIKPIQLVGVSLLALTFTVGFVAIYDQIASKQGGTGIGVFMENQAETYMFRGNDLSEMDPLQQQKIGKDVGLPKDIIEINEGGGRIDKIILPLKILSEDPVKLWAGLGVGNAMLSSVSMLSGAYGWRLGEISNDTVMSFLLWETGIGGVLLLTIFLLLLTYDAYKLTRVDNFAGTVAAGWMGVIAIVFLTVPYTNIFYFNVLIYLFALISGWIVAERNIMQSHKHALP